MKHFQRAYLRSFPGLNVLASLHLVNIQPNSKLHPLHQNSGPAPGCLNLTKGGDSLFFTVSLFTSSSR